MFIYRSDSRNKESIDLSFLLEAFRTGISQRFYQIAWGNILIHLSIWLAYKYFLWYLNVIRNGIPGDIYLAFTGFSHLIEPMIFYLYYFFLIPSYLERKKILLFAAISSLIILLIPALSIAYMHLIRGAFDTLPPDFNREINFFSHYLGISFNLVIFIILASGIRFGADWFHYQRLKTDLEKQNLLSEAALLRSQINPHFLFNTLNNIYSMSYKNNQKAPDAILKLSELMRYMIYDANAEKVPLEKEIAYIKNYIDLQKLRLNDPFQVDFKITGDFQEREITPMLMIPFVENAFKHGVVLHNPAKIFFSLQLKNNYLYFKSVNDIVKPKFYDESSIEKGIGFRNVLKRLSLLYPEKHEIVIQKKNDKFIVELSIHLN